jgi:hypothetical protein
VFSSAINAPAYCDTILSLKTQQHLKTWHSRQKKKTLCVPLFKETTRTTNVRTRGSKKYLDIPAVKKWENLKQHT